MLSVLEDYLFIPFLLHLQLLELGKEPDCFLIFYFYFYYSATLTEITLHLFAELLLHVPI